MIVTAALHRRNRQLLAGGGLHGALSLKNCLFRMRGRVATWPVSLHAQRERRQKRHKPARVLGRRAIKTTATDFVSRPGLACAVL